MYRLKKDKLPAGWDKLLILEENMQLHFNEALHRLDRMIMEIKEVQDEYDVQSSITDLTGTVKELYRHRDALHFFYDDAR